MNNDYKNPPFKKLLDSLQQQSWVGGVRITYTQQLFSLITKGFLHLRKSSFLVL